MLLAIVDIDGWCSIGGAAANRLLAILVAIVDGPTESPAAIEGRTEVAGRLTKLLA
jgi:hypothetical protein